VLTLITALMGSVALAGLAGARRTDTAVARFLQYAGPMLGQVQVQVQGDPATLDKIAALPDVAYSQIGALLLVIPVSIDGRPISPELKGSVITQATVTMPPQVRAIILAGQEPDQSRADEVALNESAAQELHAHVGSVLQLRGYRPDQMQQVMNGTKLPPPVAVNDVRVTGIIRLPTDLTDNLDSPAGVSYTGSGDIIATGAFFHQYAAAIGSFEGISFQLKDGAAGVPALQAQVKRWAGDNAQLYLGDDATASGAFAQQSTSFEALALLVFAVIVGLALLVVVGQSLVRQVRLVTADFPALRALGAAPRQLTVAALAPAVLVAVAGMTLAVPLAYGLSAFMPIGLARRAEVSPGLSFDAAAVLGGAALLGLLLAGRAALAAPRAARAGARGWVAALPRVGAAGRLAGWRLSPAAMSGIRMAFEPGRGRAAVPARAAIAGSIAALAAVLAALVFAASLSHVIGDPAVAGWDWDVAVGNPHSGDIAKQAVSQLRSDAFVSGFTVTAMGDVVLDGHDDVTLVGLQTVRGQVVPPVLAGQLPHAGNEIALGGRELRALGKTVGDTVLAHGPKGPVRLRITGEVVLSPEVTNEQTQLGAGGVMTLDAAETVSDIPMPRNVFLVSLRKPVTPAALTRLGQQFPGTVLPATPPPEVRDLSGSTALPVALALVLMLLACGTIAHTLLTSVRQRRRELAVLKTLGFVSRQVRATVAWQATAIAGVGLVVGLPLGLIAGRWAWLLFAGRAAIVPAPVISPLTLLAIPVVLALANLIAAIPARTAARTQPAMVLRAE
jgi:hypothetical protein